MDPREDRPHVLIVGGLLTEPFGYRPLRDRLLRRGAASVTIANVHVIDWMAAGLSGLGPLMTRTALAVRRAHRAAAGQPLLVVAHSGGGILVRLALSPEPFDGRREDVRDAVAALVTLGTPHGLARVPLRWRHPGAAAARHLDGIAGAGPGDPRTAFVTVGSRAVPATAWDRAPALARASRLPFRLLVGPVGPTGGDGIVGLELAHLPGAHQVTLEAATHGTLGLRWYGDESIVDQWWPAGLAAWRAAMEVRRREADGQSDSLA